MHGRSGSASSSDQFPEPSRRSPSQGQSPKAEGSAPICARPFCDRPSFQGRPGGYCSRNCREEVVLQAQEPPTIPLPVLDAVLLQDPRTEELQEVGIVGFCYAASKEEPCDMLCGSGFLGNFWPLGCCGMKLEAPREPGKRFKFANAEAAFQALKFWSRAEEFSLLSGKGASRLKTSLKGTEDFTYAGYGNNWAGMLAIMGAKFKPQTAWTEALLMTGDAFLLQHQSVPGRDKVWSNSSDGEGSNWLGLQLMLHRDRLAKQDNWTSYIGCLIDLRTGKPRGREEADEWQGLVRSATQALVAALERSALTTDSQPLPPQHRQGSQDSGPLPALANQAPPGAGARGDGTAPGPQDLALAAAGNGELPELSEMTDIKLVTTKLRVPLHRGFSWMDQDKKQKPILMSFLAKPREEPADPEPEEESDDDVPEDEIVENHFHTSGEIYAQMVKEEGAHMEALDFAAMGLLQAWDTASDGYSPQEMMALVRWLEPKLNPPPPKLPFWRQWLKQSSCRSKLYLALGASFVCLIILVLVGVFTGLAIELTKVASVRPDRVLVSSTRDSSGEFMLAGVGNAVHWHDLVDFPKLAMEDLRRMQDIAFMHRGNFHFYRVGGVSQAMGGGVRVEAEDGTVVRVAGSDVTLTQPWTRVEILDPGELHQAAVASPWAAAGAFRVLTQLVE